MKILKNCCEVLSPVKTYNRPEKNSGMKTSTGHFGIPNLAKKNGMYRKKIK